MSSSAYKPRFGYDIRIHPDPPRRAPITRGCAMPGCTGAAELRVPKTRHNMDDRQWLCREHLRQHNERWNYFADMSGDEIERFCLMPSLATPLGRSAAPPCSATSNANAPAPPLELPLRGRLCRLRGSRRARLAAPPDPVNQRPAECACHIKPRGNRQLARGQSPV